MDVCFSKKTLLNTAENAKIEDKCKLICTCIGIRYQRISYSILTVLVSEFLIDLLHDFANSRPFISRVGHYELNNADA